MNTSNEAQEARDHLEGVAREVEGRAEGAVGAATGDRHAQAEGLFDEVKGKIVQFKADIEDRIGRPRR